MEKIFDFLNQVEKLKNTLRDNQTSNGRQESTAEHCWRLSLMAFVVAEKLDLDLDVNKAVKIALVHDIAESITGDYNAVQMANGEITKEEKTKSELTAMKKIKELLSDHVGKEIYDLWQEYELAQTEEAKYIKALDKVETMTQLLEAKYEYYDYPEIIGSYGNKAVLNFPPLIPMFQIIKDRLKVNFENWNHEWKKEYNIQ